MKNAAFTLIEILIVVILLGILAAIVVPQFTENQEAAEASKIAADLQILRTQIQLYRFRENAYPATLDALVPQYIQAVPTPPAGGNYAYDADTGVVSE